MDLDLAQVQAFVAVAEDRHFGRAAARLFLTPQALSKRIIRLEMSLSEPLFHRTGRKVECTALAERLLPHARELLAAADAVVASARGRDRPLRIDVWDLFPTTVQALRRVNDTFPSLEIEMTLRRSVGDAVAALERREIDAAFGRVHDLAFPWPDGLRHRLVLLQPVRIAVVADHPLAARESVDVGDLRSGGLWWPVGDRSSEVLGYARRFSERFDVPVDTSRRGAGPTRAVDVLADEPGTVLAWDTHGRPPAGLELRSPRLWPTPLFPWSLIWRRHDRSPALAQVLDALDRVGEDEGWLVHDSAGSWLPDVDAAALRLR